LDFGDDVTILTCSYKGFPRNAIEDGVRIRRILSIRKELSRSTPVEQISFLIGSLIEGVFVVRNWKPDVIISFFGVPSGPLGWLSKKLFGIPYIISLRGGDVPGFRTYDFGTYHKLAAPIIKEVWKQADTVVANGERLRILANKFAPDQPLVVINNGVDSNFFKLKEKDQRSNHIIFTGRLVHQKGVEVVIKTLAELTHLDWEFTIIGDGPAREDLEKMVILLGLENRIHFSGWITREEIREIYWDAGIFVFPSRDEGISNAVLEAMSAGLTVIASDIHGNRHVIDEQVTGYLVPVDSVKLWKERIELILSSGGNSQEIGLAASRHVHANFSWRKMAKEYRELIIQAR
jgi:glycosyltransferase involved in cell wall biosynthesis